MTKGNIAGHLALGFSLDIYPEMFLKIFFFLPIT